MHDLRALYVSEWETWLISCSECGMLARADSRWEGLREANAVHRAQDVYGLNVA